MIDQFYMMKPHGSAVRLFHRPVGMRYRIFGGGQATAKVERWIVQMEGLPGYQSQYGLVEFTDKDEAKAYFLSLRQRVAAAGQLLVLPPYPPFTTHYADFYNQRSFYLVEQGKRLNQVSERYEPHTTYRVWHGEDTVRGTWKPVTPDFSPHKLRPIGEIE